MTTTDASSGRRPIGFLLRQLDRLLDERFERTLGARRITRRQWQLLNTLAERPAALDDLSATVAPFLDQAAGETAAPHLEPLVARRLVTRAGERYELTDAGRALFGELREEVRATRALTTRGLADGEYQRTVASLETMIANLERLPR